MTAETAGGDFTRGSIPAVVTRMALPLMAAQMVNVLYNIVDRIYIGNIPAEGSLALAGLGIAAPVISLVSAFAGLFGVGGVPLCSIARGRGDRAEAERIMGNALLLLLAASVVLMTLLWLWLTPALRLFGATPDILPYARQYLAIYTAGTPFVLVSLGMNGYINAQGLPRKGMMTVLVGALANIALDPLFIFGFGLGVAGAAWATVLSQALSAVWCLGVLRSRHTSLTLSRRTMVPSARLIRRIMALGATSFAMQLTNALMQAVTNRQLGYYGGELHLSIFVIINSLRSLFMESIHGFGAGMQPVLGYNYGARRPERVLECIRFTTRVSGALAVGVWALFEALPAPFIRLFTPEETLIAAAVPAVRLYFCGFMFMAFQSVAQNTFLGLSQSRKAIAFTLLRKVVIVVPLVLLLPRLWGLGVNGVYASEPISDLVGGGAAFAVMLLTVYRPLRRKLKEENTL